MDPQDSAELRMGMLCNDGICEIVELLEELLWQQNHTVRPFDLQNNKFETCQSLALKYERFNAQIASEIITIIPNNTKTDPKS